MLGWVMWQLFSSKLIIKSRNETFNKKIWNNFSILSLSLSQERSSCSRLSIVQILPVAEIHHFLIFLVLPVFCFFASFTKFQKYILFPLSHFSFQSLIIIIMVWQKSGTNSLKKWNGMQFCFVSVETPSSTLVNMKPLLILPPGETNQRQYLIKSQIFLSPLFFC